MDEGIDNAHLANNSVATGSKILDGAVTRAKIANDAISYLSFNSNSSSVG